MGQIKISVLMYVKNGMPYFERAVRSVMDQTLREIEILVIDGGSTDGTLEIIKTLAKEDARIHVIHSRPGVGRQFNTGLRKAKGKYIGICESDDYLMPEMYEKQYEIAEKYATDVLKADVFRFCETSDREYRFPFALSSDESIYGCMITPQTDERFLRLGVNGFWSGLYRKAFLVENDIYMNETEGASYQDITFSFLTEAYAERAYVMKEAFYCYRMDNPNSSINHPRKITILQDEYNLLKKRLKEFGDWEQYKEVYFSWKTSGHLWLYDNVSDELKEEYIELFYQDICNEIFSEKYTFGNLSTKEKEFCDAIKASADEVRMLMREKDDRFTSCCSKIKKITEAAAGKIFIFGAGNLGRVINAYLDISGRKITAYLDNDEDKWGTEIDGSMVLEPRTVVPHYNDGRYIVANAIYGRQIAEQLMTYGVPAKNIAICDNYDMFLKQVLVKVIKEGI